MPAIKQATAEFHAGKRVAVTEVSRTPHGHGSNVVYKRLRQRGYTVFAVLPRQTTSKGETFYPDLTSIPGGVDWVLIGTAGPCCGTDPVQCAEGAAAPSRFKYSW